MMGLCVAILAVEISASNMVVVVVHVVSLDAQDTVLLSVTLLFQNVIIIIIIIIIIFIFIFF